jgi:peptidoglycan/LPS O-acetylase OafA/YrhL
MASTPLPPKAKPKLLSAWRRPTQPMAPEPSLSEAKPGQTRTHEIDGLRGWAALNVVLFHIFGECMRIKLPELNSSWLNVFLDGHYAVLIFFIISGDALSQPFLQAGQMAKIDLLAIRRYFRLTIPILASCAIVYLLIQLNFDFHKEASVTLHRQDWLGRFLSFDSTPIAFVRYSLWGVYSNHTPFNSYNPFLWTMGVELTGSYIVFFLCYTWHRFKNPSLAIAIVGAFFFLMASNFFLFVFGMFLSDLRRRGIIEKLRGNQPIQFATAGLVAGAFAFVHLTNGLPLPTHIKLTFAATLVYVIYVNNFLSNFLKNKASQFLGKLSFPMYLLHFPLIISLLSWLSLEAERRGLDSPSVYLSIGAVTLFATVVIAIPFQIVESWLVKQGNHLVDLMLAPAETKGDRLA